MELLLTFGRTNVLWNTLRETMNYGLDLEEQRKNTPFDLIAKCHVPHPVLREAHSPQWLADPTPGASAIHPSPSHLGQDHKAG